MPFLDKCCVENCRGISKSRFSVPKVSHEKWEKALGKVLNKMSSEIQILKMIGHLTV